MNYWFDDKDVDLTQLNAEVAALGLPGFTGCGLIARRQIDDGTWERGPLRVKVGCDRLPGFHLLRLRAVIDAHQPTD